MRAASFVLAMLALSPTPASAEESDISEDADLVPSPSEVYRRGTSEPLGSAPWWESFGDPSLTRVIDIALRQSHDLAAARSRVDGAQARVEQATAPFYPTLTVDSTFNGSPSSSLGFQFGGLPSTGGSTLPDVIYNGSAQVNLRYSPDLFGQQRRTLRAARASLAASSDDADSAAAALAVQVAGAYFDLVASRQQVEVVRHQIELNRSFVDVLRGRYEQNQATASDVLQQRSQLASARARLPQAQSTARVARERLALLLGLGLAEADQVLPEPRAELPDLQGEAATGRPRDLLENLPSLCAAQARLRAAREQLHAAWLSAMPSLALTANAGGQMFVGSETRSTETWGFGANISLPIFRGLSERATVREARAAVREAEHTLEQAVLEAVSNVESALASEAELREQHQADEELLEVAQMAFQVSRDSYLEGVGTYLAVLTSLSALQQAELTVIQSQRALLNARLNLYLAVGGGFTRDIAGGDGGDE